MSLPWTNARTAKRSDILASSCFKSSTFFRNSRYIFDRYKYVYFCLLSLLTMIIWRYKTWWCKTFWRRSKPAIASTKTPITILYMRLMCFKPPIILLTPLVLWYVIFSFGLLIFFSGYIIYIFYGYS